jgi:hypothetical protein
MRTMFDYTVQVELKSGEQVDLIVGSNKDQAMDAYILLVNYHSEDVAVVRLWRGNKVIEGKVVSGPTEAQLNAYGQQVLADVIADLNTSE